MAGTQPSSRAWWATVALAATAGVTVAGCAKVADPMPSGPPPSPSAAHTPAGTSSTDGSSHPAAPLTGLPAASAAGAARPAVAVIISGAAPAGLGSADVVYQEITPSARYIAVFQSRRCGAVGPVTVTRPADGQILSVMHPLTGYDGGTPASIHVLDKSGVTDVDYATHRSAYASTAAGLTASTTAIVRAARGDTSPPPIFTFRGEITGATTLASTGMSRRSSVRLTIPGYGTQAWSFDPHADRWVLESGGPRVAVANLVVQTVGYKQGSGSGRGALATPKVIGSGQVTVFSGTDRGGTGGTTATGTWSRPGLHDLTNYLDADGLPMAFLQGPTWVVLAPAGTRVTASG